MNIANVPLSLFTVDCDGSVCGRVGTAARHIHPPQDGGTSLGRIRVTDGRREWAE